MMPRRRARHTHSQAPQESSVITHLKMNAGLEGILWKTLSVMSGGLCIKDCTRRSEPILSADVTPQYTAALLAGLEAARSYSPTKDPELVKL